MLVQATSGLFADPLHRGYARPVVVVKVRRVDGENVITLPPELEARGFVPGAEVAIEPLEDGEGVALVLVERTRAVARMRRLAEENRGLLDRLGRYDQEGRE